MWDLTGSEITVDKWLSYIKQFTTKKICHKWGRFYILLRYESGQTQTAGGGGLTIVHIQGNGVSLRPP